MLKKDIENQSKQSCEKLQSTKHSQVGKEYPTYNKKKEI
jgi:hypothetical protein